MTSDPNNNPEQERERQQQADERRRPPIRSMREYLELDVAAGWRCPACGSTAGRACEHCSDLIGDCKALDAGAGDR